MHKCQEALDTLDCRVNSTDVECHHCEKQENCNSALAIIELQELINKQKWHDLTKDPNDLPAKGRLIVLYIKTISGGTYYTLWKNETRDLFPTHDFIGWKYIEEFGDVRKEGSIYE